MARIYRKNEKVPVEIDDCTFFITPLSLGAKNELTAKLAGAEQGGMSAVQPMMDAARYAISQSVKGVTGIYEDDEGKVPYQLDFKEDGSLTDECIEDLSNFEASDKLTQVCLALIQGIPKQIVGPDGQPLEGVTFNKAPLKKVSRKKAEA